MQDWKGYIATTLQCDGGLPYFITWLNTPKGMFAAKTTDGEIVHVFKTYGAALDRTKIISFVRIPDNVRNAVYENTRWCYKLDTKERYINRNWRFAQ